MASPAPAGIQAISRADVHRITSGQVVLDIQSAVKELVENALDAGARTIGALGAPRCVAGNADRGMLVEVRFKEHGSESIEVIDNGSGIQSQDYDGLGRKHHTSKLSSFHDLTSVQTFGFRGEALSSLCELGHVQITTATKEEEPVGTVLDLHRDGTIQSCEKRVARQVSHLCHHTCCLCSKHIAFLHCTFSSVAQLSLSTNCLPHCRCADGSCSRTSSASSQRRRLCCKPM